MLEKLDKCIMETATEEGLLAEWQPNSGTVKQLEARTVAGGIDNSGFRSL